jgi:hypothetical protein
MAAKKQLALPFVSAATAALLACGGAGTEAPAPPPGPYARPAYTLLSETGLFSDLAALKVGPGTLAFEPTHKLWSDAAAKRRWVRLPRGTQIDTSDMDHWVFPVGTKLWKEFSRDGVLLETRLVERYGTGDEDYWMGAFVWNADRSDAVLTVDGAADVNGSTHDVPSQKDCGLCHRGDAGRVLGLSAIQMSRPRGTGQGPALAELAAMKLLSAPPASPDPGFVVPGDATTSAALGYLHANCGHCHNLHGTSWPDTQMVLRLTVAEQDPAKSELYTTTVGTPLQYWRGGAITLRAKAGDPDTSAILARMKARGTKDQMPSLATEIIDPDGVEAVRAWLTGLPAP